MSRTTFARRPGLDDLPTREAMRAPYKSRHTPARFTSRTAPARFHHTPEVIR